MYYTSLSANLDLFYTYILKYIHFLDLFSLFKWYNNRLKGIIMDY